MRVSTACGRGAVNAGSAAFALGTANGGDGTSLAAAESCTRETGGGFTCEEASDRGQHAKVDQQSGKYSHTKYSRDPVNRSDFVVTEVLKVMNLSSRLDFSERVHGCPGCDPAPGRDANSTVTMLNLDRKVLAPQNPSLEEGLGAKLGEA